MLKCSIVCQLIRSFFLILFIVIHAPIFSQDSTYEVISSGFGKTAKEAEINALRSAVEQTVGMYLESSTKIQNSQLIEDKVLSFSNGFVSSYKVVNTTRENDNVTIEIRARVAKLRVREILVSSGLNVRPIDGTSLFGEALTKIDRQKSAQSLVSELMDSYPAGAYSIKIYPPEVIGTSSTNNKAKVKIKFEISSSKDWISKFENYLSTISLSQSANTKGTEFSINFTDKSVEKISKIYNLDSEVLRNISKNIVGVGNGMPAAMFLKLSMQNYSGDTLFSQKILLSNIYGSAFYQKMGQKEMVTMINSNPTIELAPIAYNHYMHLLGRSPDTQNTTEFIDKSSWGGGFIFSSMRYPYMLAFYVVPDFHMENLFLEFECDVDILKEVTSMTASIVR